MCAHMRSGLHSISLVGALISTVLAHDDETGDAASGSGELGSGDDASSDATVTVGLLLGALLVLCVCAAIWYTIWYTIWKKKFARTSTNAGARPSSSAERSLVVVQYKGLPFPSSPVREP